MRYLPSPTLDRVRHLYVISVFCSMTESKVKSDHRSKFSNFKQLERRSLKKSRLQRDSNPWPPRYRCDALPTELWSHTLGARPIYWVHISREEWNDVKYIWNNSYTWTALLSNCLKLENLLRRSLFTLIYNRSSSIWIISYILHIMTESIG